MLWRRLALPLALLPFALAACTVSIESEPSAPKAQQATMGGLCKEAAAEQQVAAEFKPATRRDRLPDVAATIGVGTLKDGLCLDIVAEETNRVWQLKRLTLSASASGPQAEENWPMVFTKTGHPETEHVPLLVPLEGCVAVWGEAVLENPRGKERRWVARGDYGRDCALAPR